MSTDLGDLKLREACAIVNGKNEPKVTLTERPDSILVEVRSGGAILTPDGARWYARRLYWLARRCEARLKADAAKQEPGE